MNRDEVATRDLTLEQLRRLAQAVETREELNKLLDELRYSLPAREVGPKEVKDVLPKDFFMALRDRISLEGLNLSALSIEGFDFIECELASLSVQFAVFINCTFDNADVSLVGSTCAETTFTSCSFYGSRISGTFCGFFQSCSFNSTNFSGATVRASFSRCSFQRAVFEDADLADSHAAKCNFQLADFTGCTGFTGLAVNPCMGLRGLALIGPVGGSHRIIYAIAPKRNSTNPIMYRVGCFWGELEGAIAAVNTLYPRGPARSGYHWALDALTELIKLQKDWDIDKHSQHLGTAEMGGECLREASIARLEAELQQARADAVLILSAFVGANAEGVIEHQMTDADRDAIDVLITSVWDVLEDSLLVATIRRVASIPDNPQETPETSSSITE